MNNLNCYKVLIKNVRLEVKKGFKFFRNVSFFLSFFLLVSSLEAGKREKYFGPNKWSKKHRTITFSSSVKSDSKFNPSMEVDHKKIEIKPDRFIQKNSAIKKVRKSKLFLKRNKYLKRNLIKDYGDIFKGSVSLFNFGVIDQTVVEHLESLVSYNKTETVRELNLGMNKELTVVPREIGYLTGLESFISRSSGFKFIDPAIGNCKNLTKVWLHLNNIEFLPRSFAGLKNLKQLGIFDQKHGKPILLPLSLKPRVDSGELEIAGHYKFISDEEVEKLEIKAQKYLDAIPREKYKENLDEKLDGLCEEIEEEMDGFGVQEDCLVDLNELENI